MGISLERLIDIYEYSLTHSIKETADFFTIKQSSVERLLRDKRLNEKKKLRYLPDIVKNHTAEEIQAFAKNKPIQHEEIKLDYFKNEYTVYTINDLHIGSNYFNPYKLEIAIEQIKKDNPDFIVINGDIVEGPVARDGHIFQLTHNGYESQKDYAIQLLSSLRDFQVYTISGNHDLWYYYRTNVGADIVKAISKELGFIYLGMDAGEIELDGSWLVWFHGKDRGGSKTNTTKRCCDIIDMYLESGKNIQMVTTAHDHKGATCTRHRGVHGVLGGCIQDRTGFIKYNNLSYVDQGFTKVKFNIEDGKINRFVHEWFSL